MRHESQQETNEQTNKMREEKMRLQRTNERNSIAHFIYFMHNP